jgi:uroporphyrinogen decarboxylase
MNRRELFDSTMNYQEAERLLVDHGKQVSSIHKLNYNPIRAEFGLPENKDYKILDRMSQCVVTDEDLLELWGIDFRWLIPNWTNIKEIDAQHYRNTFGALFKDSGDYFAISESPLKGKGMEGLAAYEWPAVDDPGQFHGLREQAEYWHKNTDYVIGADGIKGGVLQTCLELAGYDQFFMDLVIDPEFAHALLEKVTDIYKEMYTRYLSEVGEYVQALYLTDDFGTQNSLLMSPDMWREFIMPREAALVKHIKEHAPHVKVIFHTDGSVRPLLNDMIDEMHVDILNPVQTSVEELSDTAALNADFGDRVGFHGGIDVQKVLVTMNAEEIRREVNRRICDLGQGGGYIICTCHNVGHDIPPANVKAMYDAIREFNSYPLRRLES